MTTENFRNAFKYQINIYPDESSQRIRIMVRDQRDSFETEYICSPIIYIGTAIFQAVEQHQMKKAKDMNPFAMYKNVGV